MSSHTADRFPDFARWMKAKDYAPQTCKEYPYFLDRYLSAFGRPIDPDHVSSEQDVQRIAEDVRRAIDHGGRGSGEFNLRDLQRNLIPALRLYVKFAVDEGQSLVAVDTKADELPPRVSVTLSRVVRDTKVARKVKHAHRQTCQICTGRLELTKDRFYSEGHHLKPLGKPHDGPDVEDNILCVCPNCHVKLDFLAIKIDSTKLRKATGHAVRQEFIDYHNGLCA